MLYSVPAERELYYKEVDSKKYKPFPYYLSKVIIEFILVAIGTCIYALAAYWFSGFTRTP